MGLWIQQVNRGLNKVLQVVHRYALKNRRLGFPLVQCNCIYHVVGALLISVVIERIFVMIAMIKAIVDILLLRDRNSPTTHAAPPPYSTL